MMQTVSSHRAAMFMLLTFAVESVKSAAPAIEKPVGKTTQPGEPPADPNAEIWVFDDFESSKIAWNIASWGNKGTTALAKEGESSVLKIDYTKRAGDANKVVIMKRIPQVLGSLDARPGGF